MTAVPIVIGHRGAAGYVPEHTLDSYFLAMQFGADFVEPDLVMSRDGVLIARHENEIGGTTDVAARPQFAARRTRRSIDGTQVEGWFTEDFTLAELKTLRARERIPTLRPANTRWDGRFEIPTFEEVLALVQGVEGQRAARARQLGLPPPARIGVYPETKHPSYFAALRLAMEEPLLATLERYGYRDAAAPIWLQSFEVGNLKALAQLTTLRRVQLIEASGAPYDWVAAPIPRRADATLGEPTRLVADAHAQGLALHPWTFRAENEFLPGDLRHGTAASGCGDLQGEILRFLQAGIDGFFTDQADVGVAARDAFLGGAAPRS
jgi:glycerophosphoryl diester phosphodiesterase